MEDQTSLAVVETGHPMHIVPCTGSNPAKVEMQPLQIVRPLQTVPATLQHQVRRVHPCVHDHLTGLLGHDDLCSSFRAATKCTQAKAGAQSRGQSTPDGNSPNGSGVLCEQEIQVWLQRYMHDPGYSSPIKGRSLGFRSHSSRAAEKGAAQLFESERQNERLQQLLIIIHE